MDCVTDYLPRRLNHGPWVTACTLPFLKANLAQAQIVLPICSLGTPLARLADLGEWILPPLYHEGFGAEPALKDEILNRIEQCFPYHADTSARRQFARKVEVVELPATRHPAPSEGAIIGLSVDTAVEEHGPHLPLATDTIQSYAVLQELARRFEEFSLAPPVEYGHLTWGLPFGMSIDLTPDLLTRYVAKYLTALEGWLKPEAIYVVDVHGSAVHRQAIQDGIDQARNGPVPIAPTIFRWLHEPLIEFAGDRGDQHAGGVETALIEWINPELIDTQLWPQQLEKLASEQMTMQTAIELSRDLPTFIAHVEQHGGNGVVGDLQNYRQLDASHMMQRMIDVAVRDVEQLLAESSRMS